MLKKTCEYCGGEFVLPNTHQKSLKKRFCGAVCSRRWAANNRSTAWRLKNSYAKRGERNPMFGAAQNNPNSIANLNRKGLTGKQQTAESNQSRSAALRGIKRTAEHIDKIRQTKLARGTIRRPDDPEYKEFKKYKRKVYYWTNKNDLSLLENSEKRNKKGHHLDHKYSIMMGFKNKVPPQIIGSIHNLEFIDYLQNVQKGTNCSITLEELYELFVSGN